MDIDSDVDVAALAGKTLSTEHFSPFTVVDAEHAPGMNAIGYAAHDVQDGYPFIAFMPYGSTATEHQEPTP